MSPKKKLSFTTNVIIIVSIFLLVMDGLLGAVLAYRSISKMRSIIQNKIMETSQTVALFLNGDDIKALSFDDKTNNTPAYREAYDTLATFKTHNIDNDAGLAFVYCLVKNADDKIVFSVDPSDDPADFLVEEAIVTSALLKAFSGTAAFDDVSYVDRWGDLYSAYAPIFGSDNTVKAVVGVDVWASWYNNEIASNAIAIGVITLATILLGILVVIVITRRLRKRILVLNGEMMELQDNVRELIADIRDPRYMPIKSETDEEIKESGDTVSQLKEQIIETEIAVKKYLEYTRRQAFIDVLTELNNRNSYFTLVNELESKIKNNEYVNFAVVIFDINGLKIINDMYGHEAGDKAIIMIGDCLKAIFGEEISYRIGGDEFVVVYQNVYEDTIKEKTKSFKELLVENNKTSDLGFEVGASTGYAFYNNKSDKRYQDVFNRADESMYKDKKDFYENGSIKDRRHQDN